MTLPQIVRQTDQTVLLNNAATTPPFIETLKSVQQFLKTYGALNRGAGPYADQTVRAVDKAIQQIRQFVGADEEHALLFTQNTSSAINLFARLVIYSPEDIILTSTIEHTSNNLPWRYNTNATVLEIQTDQDGSLNYEDLEEKIQLHKNHIKLVTLTGASNLSGFVLDIPRVSTLTKKYGIQLFIDAAQLAPHRPINMATSGIDALAFSAHKMYAPFGLGVLVLPKTLLDKVPIDPGGGSIDMISNKTVLWAPPTLRHQTGTWNTLGIIALGQSCAAIEQTGWTSILKHEENLVTYAAQRLSSIPNLKLHVPAEAYKNDHRIGTFPFSLSKMHHAYVSAILAHEYAIETRAGTICNHRLVRRWLQINDTQQQQVEQQIANGNRLASYGVVRASCGIHNTREDVDRLALALTEIQKNGPRQKYRPIPEQEYYVPIT